MTLKAVNHSTSSEWHDFARARLTRRFVIQDVDAWALAISDPRADYRPVALIELKRSFIAVDTWRPFAADRNNYAALLELARCAGVPFFVVYFEKGVPIVDETPLAVFRLEAAVPEYRAYRKVMRGRDFAGRFPNLTGAPA